MAVEDLSAPSGQGLEGNLTAPGTQEQLEQFEVAQALGPPGKELFPGPQEAWAGLVEKGVHTRQDGI